jgi:hypothetical protein
MREDGLALVVGVDRLETEDVAEDGDGRLEAVVKDETARKEEMYMLLYLVQVKSKKRKGNLMCQERTFHSI